MRGFCVHLTARCPCAGGGVEAACCSWPGCQAAFLALSVEEHLLRRVLMQKAVRCAASGCMTVNLRRVLDTGFRLPLWNFLKS